MRLALVMVLSMGLAGCAAPPAGDAVAMPAGGGGGGGYAGPLVAGPGAWPADRDPGERVSAAACPVDFAAALEAAIAAVPDRVGHDTLEVERRAIETRLGASESARLAAVSNLQATAARLAAAGHLTVAEADRIADLAACYMGP